MREILLLVVMMFSFTAYASVDQVQSGFESYEVDKSKVTIHNPAKMTIQSERSLNVTDGNTLTSNELINDLSQDDNTLSGVNKAELPFEVGWRNSYS